jgi:putative oxidoreductase
MEDNMSLTSTANRHRVQLGERAAAPGRPAVAGPSPAPFGALVLRLSLAAIFLTHALVKPLLFSMPGTVQFFEEHGFPGWTAYAVFGAELVGGTLLLLGVGTRWAAAALIPVTAGALSVHAPNGFFFFNPGGGWELLAFLIAALAAQVLLGDGALSIHVPWPRNGPPHHAPASDGGEGRRFPFTGRWQGPANDLD